MTENTKLTVRVAQPEDLRRVNEVYTTFGYTGTTEAKDIVLLAERSGGIIGLVRLTEEGGITLLRGMYVAPHTQRQGVGSALLERFVSLLSGRACFCLPYTHLVGFYGAGGFRVLPPERAPAFLAQRLTLYQADGGDVRLMWRPKAEPDDPDRQA